MSKRQTSKSKRKSSKKIPHAPGKGVSDLRLPDGSADGWSDGLKGLESVLHLMERHEIAELDWSGSGHRIRLKTKHAVVAPVVSVAGLNRAGWEGQQSESVGSARSASSRPSSSMPSQTTLETSEGGSSPVLGQALAPNQKQMVSPLVGTFYRSPSPEAEPYVKDGQFVKRGEVLCIIEAMKLMNEIEAEYSGKVVSVLAENGQPVEYGEPLFVIEAQATQ